MRRFCRRPTEKIKCSEDTQVHKKGRVRITKKMSAREGAYKNHVEVHRTFAALQLSRCLLGQCSKSTGMVSKG
jgi:hypothetical protein